METMFASSRLPRFLPLFLFILVPVASSRAAGREISVADPVTESALDAAPHGPGQAENIKFKSSIISTFLIAGKEDSITINNWPAAPGIRESYQFTRRDFTGAGTKILVASDKGMKEISKSKLLFFIGSSTRDGTARSLIAVNPESSQLNAYFHSPKGSYEMRLGHDNKYVLAAADAFIPPEVNTAYVCGQETLPPAPILPETTAQSFEAVSGPPYRLTLAIDTDNEFMSAKFSNNATAASDYIATLIALMSAIYERDLQVYLEQGTTILRPSTTADPYAQSGSGNADTAKLNEFSNYWSSHYGSVNRGATLLLSGKGSNANGSSGIAWLRQLCSTSHGYGFIQVFKFSGSTASTDTMVSAHELGHIFGSPHTHCYAPPIDSCYAGELGCYSGAPSCPAAQSMNGLPNVRGSLMSYCHLLSGCSASPVYHPTSVSLLSPIVAGKLGLCVFPLGDTLAPAAPIGLQ